MESYYETVYRIEGFGSQRLSQVFKIITSKVCEHYGIIKPPTMNDTDFFSTILLSPQYRYVYDMLHYLLKANGVNEKCLLMVALTLVSEFNISSFTRAQMTDSFVCLPTVYSYDGNTLKCRFGTLEIEQLYKYANTGKLKLGKEKTFRSRCFEVTQMFADKLGDDDIVVSRLPNLFGGEYLHAYYQLKEGTLDLACGLFFKGDAFQTLAEPTEIIKFPARELSERYIDLAIKDKTLPPSLYPVLVLALDKVRKGK